MGDGGLQFAQCFGGLGVHFHQRRRAGIHALKFRQHAAYCAALRQHRGFALA